MKKKLSTEPEPTIKRSRAAFLLDKTPRTLRRYEVDGLLTPIKINERATVYKLGQVEALLRGRAIPSQKQTQPAQSRTLAGTFAPALSSSRTLPS